MTCDRSRPPAHRNYNLLGFPRTRASGHFVREEPTAGLRSEQEIPPMNPNPFSDTITFLVQPGLTTAIFWVLLVASAAIAVYVYRTIPGQRSVENVGNWAFRLLIGCMWWQQSLWKLPPDYTGLAYWMGLMGKHAAIPLQAYFVNQIVLPHLHLFAPVVLCGRSIDRGFADPRALRAGLGADRRSANPQSVARSLQRARRMAVDLCLPVCTDAGLCSAPLRPLPWP